MLSSRSLNKYEKILAQKNPEQARHIMKLAFKASFEEKVRYWDDGNDGGDSNAFLHAYWSALIYKNISKEWSILWTKAHEENEHEDFYTEMDLFNNELGLKIFEDNTNQTNDELANLVELWIDQGKGKKIKNNRLVPTEKNNKRDLNIFESIIEKALSLVSKLIAQSTDSRNGDGMTPLIFAANQNEIEAVKIAFGLSEVDDVDNYGDSALFHSVRCETNEVCAYLIEAGANLSNINKINGKTLLMEAVSSNNLFIAHELVKKGVSIDAKDRFGNTAYDISVYEGIESNYQFLKLS